MHIFAKNISGKYVRFASSPGIPLWNQVTPAAQLLGEHVELKSGDSVLWLGCGHAAGATLVAMRHPYAKLMLVDRSVLAIEAAEETVRLNTCQNAEVSHNIAMLIEPVHTCNSVVIELPKGRKLAQRYLVIAQKSLIPGGSIYLAGDRKEGMLSSVHDAEDLFGKSALLDYQKGSRIVYWNPTPNDRKHPAWMSEPGILPGTWHEFTMETILGKFNLCSLPGVFSFDHLDHGTRLLLENISINPGEHVLDFGCGYGIIGLAAARLGAGRVDYVDVDLLAIASTQKNLERYPHSGACCMAMNGTSELEANRYNLILSNPPFHAGKGVEYSMTESFIKDSIRILKPGGRLLLVVNTFIPYQKILSQVYQQITLLRSTSKFNIWQAVK